MQQTKQRLPWAERVDELLDKKDRLPSWLAKRLNMDHSQLSRLMNGQGRYRLSPELKTRIADILEVPESWIFGDNGQSDC